MSHPMTSVTCHMTCTREMDGVTSGALYQRRDILGHGGVTVFCGWHQFTKHVQMFCAF